MVEIFTGRFPSEIDVCVISVSCLHQTMDGRTVVGERQK